MRRHLQPRHEMIMQVFANPADHGQCQCPFPVSDPPANAGEKELRRVDGAAGEHDCEAASVLIWPFST